MKQNFAVTVARVDNNWQVRTFKDDFSDATTAAKAVRNLRAEGPAFALLCVEDDYFVLVRPGPSRVQYFISDASAALEDDFAADILDELECDQPEDETPYAEGDFDILADLGLSAQVLSVIADEVEWWATEQIQQLAEELGFDEALAEAL